uniref:Alternative protein TRAFD1 n=1 Tax=Homo sapiens TaxID=9606 RepID=L8E7W3_HUMAN|nr:alternative protein TRAFD1 [Homo sapiens]
MFSTIELPTKGTLQPRFQFRIICLKNKRGRKGIEANSPPKRVVKRVQTWTSCWP